PDPTDPVDGYYLSLQNGGFYSTSGVEGEITYRPSQYNMYKFWFNKAKDLDLGQKNMEQAFLLNSPEKTPDNALGVMGSCEINQFRLSTMGFYIDRLNWDNSSETVNPYFRLDANVSRTFSIAGQIKATIKLGGQSLTGSYNEYSDQFEVDPHYYVSAKMEEFQMPRGLAKNEQKQRHAVPLRQSGR
ncbi:MAG: hypothetical protein SVC26_09150, partial [Pseudomonadota bacterium]|nr:hypothetical protein [Pseudomonadota bacterium]